jgi:hypothetical protein
MPELLSYDEIRQRYDGQWVIIAHTELDENLEVISGEVLAHSPEETEIYKFLPVSRGRDVSIEYIGKIPEDLVFIL